MFAVIWVVCMVFDWLLWIVYLLAYLLSVTTFVVAGFLVLSYIVVYCYFRVLLCYLFCLLLL